MEMLQVTSTGKRSSNPSSAVNSQDTSDSFPAIRQSGEHSSCATDSVDRFSGNTETDTEHQEDPEAQRDHPSCAKTVPTIQEIQKIVEVSQALLMDEVVGMPVVTKGKDVRIRRARRLEGCHRSRTLMRLPVFP